MVYPNIFRIVYDRDGVTGSAMILMVAVEMQIADDDILLVVDPESEWADTDIVAVAVNRFVGFHLNIGTERNRAAHGKMNEIGVVAFQRFTQAARTGIVEVGNRVSRAACASGSVSAEADGRIAKLRERDICDE